MTKLKGGNMVWWESDLYSCWCGLLYTVTPPPQLSKMFVVMHPMVLEEVTAAVPLVQTFVLVAFSHWSWLGSEKSELAELAVRTGLSSESARSLELSLYPS